MVQAERSYTIRFLIAASREAEVIDMVTGEIITAPEAHRRALLRREWAAYGFNGEIA